MNKFDHYKILADIFRYPDEILGKRMKDFQLLVYEQLPEQERRQDSGRLRRGRETPREGKKGGLGDGTLALEVLGREVTGDREDTGVRVLVLGRVVVFGRGVDFGRGVVLGRGVVFGLVGVLERTDEGLEAGRVVLGACFRGAGRLVLAPRVEGELFFRSFSLWAPAMGIIIPRRARAAMRILSLVMAFLHFSGRRGWKADEMYVSVLA